MLVYDWLQNDGLLAKLLCLNLSSKDEAGPFQLAVDDSLLAAVAAFRNSGLPSKRIVNLFASNGSQFAAAL